MRVDKESNVMLLTQLSTQICNLLKPSKVNGKNTCKILLNQLSTMKCNISKHIKGRQIGYINSSFIKKQNKLHWILHSLPNQNKLHRFGHV